MISIDGNHLTIEDIVAVARQREKVSISPTAKEAIDRASRMISNIASQGEVVYGVTTGFGKLAHVTISQKETSELQKNLIRSHAVGVGDNLPEEVVRAIMLLRANTLAKGYSGIRLEVIQLLVDMLNCGLHPIIPSQGSVGASGDLVPLAHMTLPLIGEGEILLEGSIVSGKTALQRFGLEPVELEAKEGLALINGTAVMTAIAALAVFDSEIILDTADVAAAMSIEALKGIGAAFDAKVHQVRPHAGQMKSAANLRFLLEGSELISSPGKVRVQDPYSLRCTPQVHGASRDALSYVRTVVETEINAVTDNPLVFPAVKEVISAGNFHGQPVALAMDFLGMALSELANIANSRISQLLTADDIELPPFLVYNSGLNTGLMLAQYTAASLVSENKVLSSPASVDSIPTSGFQEDHVSMGTIAARKAREILRNVINVTSIELLCAAQALDFHLPCRLGQGTEKAYKCVREHVLPLKKDRALYPEVRKLAELVRSGEIRARAYNKTYHENSCRETSKNIPISPDNYSASRQ